MAQLSTPGGKPHEWIMSLKRPGQVCLTNKLFFQVAEVEALLDLQIVIDSRNRPLAVHRNVLLVGRERN